MNFATVPGPNTAVVLPDGDGSRPDPPRDLIETGHLVLGPGARKDSANPFRAVLPHLTPEQQETVQRAKKYAMEQSIKMVLMKQTLAHQQQQAKSMQRHQALILMCRIYVGSINFEVKEDTIRQAFLPFGPIRSISMSWDPITQRHKGFAFVEFEVPEAAQLALEQMNGVIISGRNIKVGRPSNMPQAQAVIEEITHESKSYNRIYIASIHQDLTRDDIKSVFEAFGTILTCELAMTTVPGRHKGYGFIEYETLQSALEAISSMNLFDLGGQYLRVGRAITPPDTPLQPPSSTTPQLLPTAAAVAAAAATAKIQAMDAVATNLGLSSEKIVTTASNSFQASSKFGPPVATAIPPPSVVVAPPTVVQPSVQTAAIPAPGIVVPTSLGAPIVAATQANPVTQPAPSVPVTTTAGTMPAPTTSAGSDPSALLAKVEAEAKKKQQEDLQKKLIEGQEPATLHQQENMSIKGQSARHLVMQRLMRDQSESVVVVLRNMVGPEDVDEELQEEIEEECTKYGEVERVVIYQEKQSEEENAEVLVKIFVEFKTSEATKRAKESLHNRFFGGRRVIAQIYDQNLYDHNDLSG